MVLILYFLQFSTIRVMITICITRSNYFMINLKKKYTEEPFYTIQ